MLIDVADAGLNHELVAFGSRKIAADVSSLTLDVNRFVVVAWRVARQ
ncbi:MAG: hypothetical protein MZW92_49955 [Comamonadaceae bacterium]|nr:hypothetical protein [Comamonadaceae bacterium]